MLLADALQQFVNSAYSNTTNLKIDLIEYSTKVQTINEGCTNKSELLENIKSDSDTALNHLLDPIVTEYNGVLALNHEMEERWNEYKETFGGERFPGNALKTAEARINNIKANDEDRKVYLVNLTNGICSDSYDAQVGKEYLKNKIVPNTNKVYDVIFGINEDDYVSNSEYIVFVPNNTDYGHTYFTSAEDDKNIKETYQEILEDILNDACDVQEKLEVKFKDYIEIKENNEIYLKYIQPNSTQEMIKENVITNGTIKMFRGSQEISDSKAKGYTGEKMGIDLHGERKSYTLCVMGDTDGNGNVDMSDLLRINKHRINKQFLSEENLIAGDVNKDDKVDLKDLLRVNKFRLGKITQFK